MWTLLLVLGLFTLAKGGEIYDVTTIYDLGRCHDLSEYSSSMVLCQLVNGITLCGIVNESCPEGVEGRVHARTNALGLAYHDINGQSIDRNSLPSSHLICDFQEGDCHWDTSKWEYIPIKTGLTFVEGEHYPLIKQQIISSVSMTGNRQYGILYVTTGINRVMENILFLITFYNYVNEATIYWNCNPEANQYRIDNLYDRNDHNPYIYCDDSSTKYQFDTNINYLLLELKGLNLQLYSDLAKQNLMHECTIQEEDTNNIFYTLSNILPSEHSLIVPVLLSPEVPSLEISSPHFSPDGREFCLAIVMKASQTTETEVLLKIFAEDVYQVQHFLQSVHDVKDYFQVKHYNILLHNNIPTPVKIIFKSVGPVQVEIARISSCNVEGEEVEEIPKFQPPAYLNSLKTYNFSVYSPNILGLSISIYSKNNSCLNGGVLTSDGCACRPGFVGQNCETGCGENRFGQDCLGLCSLHDQECKGLLLCTNITGCHCAPGYSGEICTNVYVYYESKPKLSSNDYNTLTVSFDPNKGIKGYGKPELYQIQYREQGSQWLIHFTKSLTSSGNSQEEMEKTISEDITALKDGAVYEVRILLMDSNFNKYDGDLVGVGEIVTKCDIPAYYNYKIKSSSDTKSFTFSWSYVNETIHSCPLEGYEISWKDGWKWYTNFTADNSVVLPGFLPGSTIKFKVRAKTTGGYAPYSNIMQTTTQAYGSTSVRDLHIISSQSSSVSISWNPPRGSESRQLQYTISYKCIEQPACYPGCHNATEGLLTQEQTSVVLSSLLPFAQYLVTVTPLGGKKSGIYVGTSKVAAIETPKLSSSPPQRTNTSITVFWEEVPVCSSFLQGYNYQLSKRKEDIKILSSGFTKDTKLSFHNLTASTEYVVKIFIVTVAGWNSENFLSVEVSTSATVPEAVRSLEIYKRGRNMLGLRWAEPLALYGQLKSFAVSHSLGHNNVTTQTVTPTPCVAWPHLYCHTIEGLKTGRRYNITVSAKNDEVEENGEESTVSGITKESLPTAPENLKELNKSSTSVALQWGYPNLTNGVLRTFLISVEETEMHDQDSCCQIYPLVETPVNEEALHYDAEVSGLHPAATYFVSVSAKTVGLGPSQSLVIHTRPPHLPFTAVPQTDLDLTWLPQQQLPEVNNSDIYTSLIRTHLVIAVSNDSILPIDFAETGILDSQLESLLKKTVNKPFTFVTEYNPDDLTEFSFDNTDTESTWGRVAIAYLFLKEHQLVAVQVTEYNGAFNVDLRYSVAT